MIGTLVASRTDASVLLESARGLVFARPAVSSTTAVPAERPDADLQARVSAAAHLSQGTTGAVVFDLASGAMATVNPDRVFPAASLFKLPILVEVLRQERQHLLEPDRLLEIRPEDWTDGSGILQARVGERLPVRELLRLMIQDSDNIAALVLLDAVGVDNVNATLDQLGLYATRVRDHRHAEPGPHVTTPRDMAQLLSRIASGQLVDAPTSEAAVRLLELKQAKTWLAEGLPWWAKIAHKWGDLPDARHDAGIVFSSRGAYVSVVLSENGRPDDVEQAIARTARAGYDYLGDHTSP